MELSINKTLYIDITETTIYNRKTHYDVICKVSFYTDIEKTVLDHSEDIKMENLNQSEIDFESIVQRIITNLNQ